MNDHALGLWIYKIPYVPVHICDELTLIFEIKLTCVMHCSVTYKVGLLILPVTDLKNLTCKVYHSAAFDVGL